MKFLTTKPLVYLLGCFSGFCFSVLLSYVTLTSVTKSTNHLLHSGKYIAHAIRSSATNTSYLKTLPEAESPSKPEPIPNLKTSPNVENKTETITQTTTPSILDTPLRRYVKHVRFHREYIHCGSIFDGNSDEINRANNYLQKHNHSFPDSVFINLTSDCNAFKKELGYTRHYSKEEIEFPLAFGLLTHDNIEQVERLLRDIYAPQNVYCIHVDAKSPIQFLNAVKSLASCFPNVFVTSRLERVIYAHFSRLKAEMNCIEDLLNTSTTWKYYLNLATSEIPLRTNLGIVKYLKFINGSNDIAGTYKRRVPSRYIYRYVAFEDTIHRTKLLNPPPPHNLTIAKGQAYGAFSRKFLEFTVSNKMARDLFIWSKYTHSPDEQYWATLNNLYHNPFLNSPGGSKVLPERTRYNGRFIKWYRKDGYCKGKNRHNICVYGVGDLPDLKTITKLVANKFNVNFDPFAVACMEELLYNKTLAEGK